jgi:hypothetical protein
MAACDCCGTDKPDVKIRVGLRGADSRGNITATPFHGPLCNDCLARTSESGSTEQRWLFHQIMQRLNTSQVLGAKPRHGTVMPLGPGRATPVGSSSTLAAPHKSSGARKIHR